MLPLSFAFANNFSKSISTPKILYNSVNFYRKSFKQT